MVPKQPTNQPTDRRAGHNQPTNKLRRVSENDRKLKKRFRFQLSPCEKQSCSLLCHCKAARNTLTNTQVPQTSKTRPHARNNWGTWRGHNNQLQESRRVAGTTRGRLQESRRVAGAARTTSRVAACGRHARVGCSDKQQDFLSRLKVLGMSWKKVFRLSC